ncbi:MAG: PAS domain S-box protein, partial [Gemmatimonadota bacterium]
MKVTTGARPDRIAADSSLGSSRAFEALFMSSTVAIVAIDRDGRVLMWNRGAERLLGWTEEEVVGRILPVIAPEDRERFASVRARVMDGQEIDGMVVSHVHSDGSRVDLELSLRALSDEPGEPPRAILGVAIEPSGSSRAGELADRIERLEGRLAASRLPPHFLFNSLHAIHVLLRRGDNGQAASMPEHLSDILRHAVRSGEVG